jgi:hypothetical protein
MTGDAALGNPREDSFRLGCLSRPRSWSSNYPKHEFPLDPVILVRILVYPLSIMSVVRTF